jgi:hypothetical protein
MGRNYTSFIRMKKTLLALFAVLLVLSLAACDFFLLPPDTGDGWSRYPDANDGMVSLNINVGGGGTSRALDIDVAMGNADFYEVVFKGPDNKFYEANWVSGTVNITIPVGDYTGAEKATLFAGHYDGSDKILLGIGEIFEIDNDELSVRPGGLANTAFIGPGTHNVTFKVRALKTSVTTDKATSSFQILGPTSPTNYETGSAGPNPTITVGGGTTYPIFPIPPRPYTNPTGSFSDVSTNIIGQYTVDLTSHSAAVILDGNWSATVVQYTGPAATYTLGGATASADTGTITCPAENAGALLSISNNVCTFKFMVDLSVVGGTDGLFQVLIKAPVRALAPISGSTYGTGTPVTWHIMGGAVKTMPDGGAGTSGALIILDVGGTP